jgi:hypothetical protein
MVGRDKVLIRFLQRIFVGGTNQRDYKIFVVGCMVVNRSGFIYVNIQIITPCVFGYAENYSRWQEKGQMK